MNWVLIVMSIPLFGMAVFGVMKGHIYCKGHYARAERPITFWASVVVYIAFGFMLLYFGFKTS